MIQARCDRELRFCVSPSDANQRLDVYLSARSQISRSQVQRLIEEGRVLLEGKPWRKYQRVKPGEMAILSLPPPQPSDLSPEALPLHVLFEDEALIVLNKEPGMVVHPAPGHSSGTLVHALLHHCPDLGGIGGILRPGIVHRLDKDTSGLLVVAKTEESLRSLAEQFKSREVSKEYLALVLGEMRQDRGEVDVPIGRQEGDRKKMGVRTRKGRSAMTRYQVLERFPGLTLVLVMPHTGRTHQIRVHLSHIGHPILGDPIYGGRRGSISMETRKDLGAKRQMLHALRLDFNHPGSGERLGLKAPLPSDFRMILEAIGSRITLLELAGGEL